MFLPPSLVDNPGYVAANFPGYTPTPKAYMAVTRGLHFINTNGFLGLADEQTVEEGHAYWGRIRRRFQHCKNQTEAALSCLKFNHSRNNCALMVAAEKRKEHDAAG